MFESYNLINLIKWGGVTFWGSYSTKEIQNPTVVSLILHLFFFKKAIFLTMSKIAKFDYKSLKNFRN